MHIETKFAPGDEVWMMYDNKPRAFEVLSLSIRVEPKDGMYSGSFDIQTGYFVAAFSTSLDEKSVFASKAELLASL